MRAVVVRPPEVGARVVDRTAPPRGPKEVRVAVREVGVCGTDRDIAGGKYGVAPPGRSDLILGHENLGRVAEAPADGAIRVGDWVVATVRRGCAECSFCRSGHPDLCRTGRFTERGISGADGYWAEEYVELPEYLVPVPESLRATAVLLEPATVVEKALRVAARVQAARLPEEAEAPPSVALVAGTGAVGMIASAVLALRGARVTAIDRHPGDTPAARMLRMIGAEHRALTELPEPEDFGPFDLALEATGSVDLPLGLSHQLRRDGVLALTGIPPTDSAPVPAPVGSWARRHVLGNLVTLGSVNAGREDFERGVRDLAALEARWPGWVEDLITRRAPLEEAPAILADRAPGEIKTVLSLAG